MGYVYKKDPTIGGGGLYEDQPVVEQENEEDDDWNFTPEWAFMQNVLERL